MADQNFTLGIDIDTGPARRALRGMDKDLDDLNKKTSSFGKQAGQGFGSASRGAASAAVSFRGLGSAIAGLGIAGLVQQTVQVIREFDSLAVTLETVTGSARGASESLALIQSVAKQTPFGVNQISESFIKLQSAGIKPTSELLTLFSDVASVTTDRIGALQAITDLYARTTAGGLGLEELNRLADRGIPVFDILAKRIGVSRLQVSELGKTAQGAQIIIGELEAGLKTAFAGQSARQLNTLDGQINALNESFRELAVGAGQAGLSTGLTDLVRGLNQATQAIKPISDFFGGAFGAFLSGLGSIISGLVSGFKLVLTSILAIGVAALALKTTMAGIAVATFAFRNALAGVAIASAAAFSTGNIAGVATVLAGITVSVQRLRAGLAAAFGAGLIAALRTIVDIVKVIVRVLFQLATATPLGRFVTGVVAVAAAIGLLKDKTIEADGATASFGEIFEYYWKRAANFVNTVTDAIGNLLTRLGQLAKATVPDWLKDLASRGIDMITPTTAIKQIDAERRQTQQDANRKSFREQEVADAEALLRGQRDVQAQINELITGKGKSVEKIVRDLRFETSLIALSRQEAEAQQKIFELQEEVRGKLLQAGKSEAEAAKESRLSAEQAGKIRSAVASKYTAEVTRQFNIIKKNNDDEIRFLGLNSLEQERQRRIKQTLVDLGIEETANAKQRLAAETEVSRVLNAQVDARIKGNVESITREIELLKLGNKERERAIDLDRAAQDAGFRNAAEFQQARPGDAATIGKLLEARQTAALNAQVKQNADDSIRSLREELAVISILNEKERERFATLQQIKIQIDPEGRGANIATAQQVQIEGLIKQIELQKQLIEINRQITDGFADLGQAATDWALKTEGAGRRIALVLIRLLALEALRRNNPGGALGTFIGGVVQGLSGARANGGPVGAGQTYLVGERGPELFTPPRSGYIVPNNRMGGSAGTSITVAPSLVVNGSVTGQTELDRMFDEFATATARSVEQYVIGQSGQLGILRR